MSTGVVPFDALAGADLVVDCVYRGGSKGHVGDDPLALLLRVGNQGGFRYYGSPLKDTVRLVALYTSGAEEDWPDKLDPTTGDFTYFGDNRRPGSGLLETRRRGNLLLQRVFERSHWGPAERECVPPFFLFESAGSGRDVSFRGLLAPGSPRLSPEEELVAVWRTTGKWRFQNYRAHFTVLDVPTVGRDWIVDILAGRPLGATCPPVWRQWVRSRSYRALESPRTVTIRTPSEQTPPSGQPLAIVNAIYEHFRNYTHLFEHFAADLWLMSDRQVSSVDVTRPSRDGGRDAVGEYVIGPRSDPVRIRFALEAKCYRPGNGVGVREVSRLVSRLRHRDFGVFVTTSHIDRQAYQEIRDDGHPVVVISGADIVDILSRAGHRNVNDVVSYLRSNHSTDTPEPVRVDLSNSTATQPEAEIALANAPSEPGINAPASRWNIKNVDCGVAGD